MSLTPIKVRNKRKKTMAPTSKGSTLLGRGRPFKSQNNSSASHTDAEGDSSSTNPRKRRKTRHTRQLAPLERLPAEILQNIFFRSRNVDLMFSSKSVMQKLEKSEHVKLEFIFSTLFWPIINGEVNPDINGRPDLRHASRDGDNDDTGLVDSLLAHAQSRLLSCRFFTAEWFHQYMLKAYDKWNTLHASSQPERVMEIFSAGWGDVSLLSGNHRPEFRWITHRRDLQPEDVRVTGERKENEENERHNLAPIAFHPSTRIPIKFFRSSMYLPRALSIRYPRGLHSYDLLGLLYNGLRLKIPVRGDDFDDLVRGALRDGDSYLFTLLLLLRVDELPYAPLPADLLRVAVLECGCIELDAIEFILQSRFCSKAYLQDIDLLDPALWAWADKNDEKGRGTWLKANLREALNYIG
ncbi:hypothetical protein IWZ03DRAFT_237128 [Phyllosticta citriasiana]|uniref:F-box domain-containing protein n=1 Tax=Phyllosticta citriasiana TaxID=595635 RepID=A0ABR1KFM2_9PEZI